MEKLKHNELIDGEYYQTLETSDGSPKICCWAFKKDGTNSVPYILINDDQSIMHSRGAQSPASVVSDTRVYLPATSEQIAFIRKHIEKLSSLSKFLKLF